MRPESNRKADPSLLDILGMILQLVGLVDQTFSSLGRARRQVVKRHKAIARGVNRILTAVDDARASLRILASTISVPDRVPDTHTRRLDTRPDDLPLVQRGVGGLHEAIGKIRSAAYDLEAATLDLPVEAQRYFRIAEDSDAVLALLQDAQGDARRLPDLLTRVDAFLRGVHDELVETRRWQQDVPRNGKRT